MIDRNVLVANKMKFCSTEIRELLSLKDWTNTRLAAELGVTRSAIQRWLVDERCPNGSAVILMSQMLRQARQEAGVAELQEATA